MTPDRPAPLSQGGSTPDLPVVTPPQPVPVYDCRVIVSGPDAQGRLFGRVTNLPGLSTSARTERELLTQLVQQFKQTLMRYRSEGQPVPWNPHPEHPREGERQRWIPVHL
jgi:hypothetical protein